MTPPHPRQEKIWRPVLNRSLASLTLTSALAAALLLAGCGPQPPVEQSTEQPASEQPARQQSGRPSGEPVEEATELRIEDITEGTGAEAQPGQVAVVHYTGWLADGTRFDSSLDAGRPFEFTIGAGEVISGWDQGVAGMKVGGTRRLIIPPALGYGEQGAGGVIPPNATLVFEVELLEVR
jgi:FKBP-type peptidyl-prolyl cis-trans isomerase